MGTANSRPFPAASLVTVDVADPPAGAAPLGFHRYAQPTPHVPTTPQPKPSSTSCLTLPPISCLAVSF
eukprot:4569601-Amphidinium_carterae.3